MKHEIVYDQHTGEVINFSFDGFGDMQKKYYSEYPELKIAPISSLDYNLLLENHSNEQCKAYYSNNAIWLDYDEEDDKSDYFKY